MKGKIIKRQVYFCFIKSKDIGSHKVKASFPFLFSIKFITLWFQRIFAHIQAILFIFQIHVVACYIQFCTLLFFLIMYLGDLDTLVAKASSYYVGLHYVSHSVASDSFATPWTVAHQAPWSMGFSRQEYWRGVIISFSKDFIIWIYNNLFNNLATDGHLSWFYFNAYNKTILQRLILSLTICHFIHLHHISIG